MKKSWIASVLALVLLQHAHAAEPVIDTSVDQKAREWLVHLDSGQPDQAWETGSPALRKALALDDWRKALKGVANVGAVQGRTLSSVTFANKIPGGQDGQYALLHYDSVFEHKNRATETVILLRDADGVWRSAGYFLK
jgi:hypothetical protein